MTREPLLFSLPQSGRLRPSGSGRLQPLAPLTPHSSVPGRDAGLCNHHQPRAAMGRPRIVPVARSVSRQSSVGAVSIGVPGADRASATPGATATRTYGHRRGRATSRSASTVGTTIPIQPIDRCYSNAVVRDRQLVAACRNSWRQVSKPAPLAGTVVTVRLPFRHAGRQLTKAALCRRRLQTSPTPVIGERLLMAGCGYSSPASCITSR